MKPPFIEVIIVFKTLDKFILESVKHCLKLDYKNFSILLVPDEKIDFPIKDEKIRIVVSGLISIPKKRNVGIKNSLKKTEFIAFVDSDAFPHKNWLQNSIKYFNKKQTLAVGGPNLTPPNEEFKRKIAGNVIKQKIAIGESAIRHKSYKTQYLNELPTCNLIVRKSFLDNNLFDESLTTGEDAQLCSSIIKKKGKILYAKDVIVFHHRRRIFKPLLKQYYYYGYFKAQLFFKKQLHSKYYLAPPLFLVYLVFGIIFSFFSKIFFLIFFSSIAVYLLIIFFSSSYNSQYNPEVLPTTLCVFLVHISYGSGFLASFFQRTLLKIKRDSRTISANE